MRKTKVVHVLNSLCFGGVENSVVAFCNKLDKERYEVIILVLSNSDNYILDRIDNSVRVVIMPIKYHNSTIRNIVNLFLYNLRLANIFIELMPDIIHTHIYQYNSIPLLLAMKLSRIKMKHFHTIHSTGLHYECRVLAHKIKLKVERFFYRRFKSNLVCVSKEVGRNTQKLLTGCVECRVIPNGVDLDVFNRGLYPLRNNSRDLELIYVSRLVEGKNHITLLKAMDIIVDKYPDVYLTLVGDGELRRELECFVKDSNLENHVRFLGNRNDIPALLAKADVGVFPSEYEGFSVALVEMMAVQLAIICSDISNFRDLCLTEGDILFFDVFDDQMLAGQIERLYIDRDYLLRQQQAAYKISEQYSMQNVTNKLDCYYLQREL